MVKKPRNKGVALFVSLALLFLLSVGSAIVLLTAYNYTNISENQIRRTMALAASEAGIHYAYWKIRIGKDDDNNSLSFPAALTPPISLPSGWFIQVDITEDVLTGRKTIRSTVNYPKASVI